MPDLTPEDTQARNRFFLINAMRVGGVVMVLVGLLVSQQKIDLPFWTAYLLIVLGMAEAFVMPLVLARLWRSEKR
jgi:hypothetical protein